MRRALQILILVAAAALAGSAAVYCEYAHALYQKSKQEELQHGSRNSNYTD